MTGRASDAAWGPSLCAHTDFECDCNCGCRNYDGNPSHECDWPDCECGCRPDCKGCAMVQDQAELRSWLT